MFLYDIICDGSVEATGLSFSEANQMAAELRREGYSVQVVMS